jgi:hypothetical protein
MGLSYSKNAQVKGFVGIPDTIDLFGAGQGFEGIEKKTPTEQIDAIYTKANSCRWWYEPSFADEHQLMPTSTKDQPTVLEVKAKTDDLGLLLTPPNKVEDNTLGKALLIGVGIFVVYKILS